MRFPLGCEGQCSIPKSLGPAAGEQAPCPALRCPHRDQTTEGRGMGPRACLTEGTRDRTLCSFRWRDAGQNPVLIQPEGRGMEPRASPTRGTLCGTRACLPGGLCPFCSR